MTENQTVKDRIKFFINYLGIGQSKFEKECNLSNGYINNLKGNIGTSKLEYILKAYPELNINWLVYGDGEMLNSTLPTVKQTNNPKEGIPLIPVEAMAGALTCDQTVLEYECDRYVVPMFKGADFLIPVKGSSMYPKYSSGDIVACQRVDMNNLFFQWNKVYVIDTNQGALIKRIKPGHDENHVLIVSDNEKYDPFELPYSAIHAVALVIGVIRLE